MGTFLRRTMKFLRRVRPPTRNARPLGSLSMPETDDSHRGEYGGCIRWTRTFGGKKLYYGAHFSVGWFIIH